MDMTAFAFFSTAHTFTALPALAAACSSSQDATSQNRYVHQVTEHTCTALAMCIKTPDAVRVLP